MKNIVLIISLFLIGNYCFSQGGWDIKYIPIDSINQSLVGHDVKLDFKTESESIGTFPKGSLHFLSLEDTVLIRLGGKKIKLAEQRKIYADWGFYDEQFLEGKEYGENEVLRIYHSVIEEEKIDSLHVRLYIEIYHKLKGRKDDLGPEKRYCLNQWIPKAKLSGVMIKKTDH